MGAIAAEVRDVIGKYVGELRALGVHPVRVVLFGSHARGAAGPWSDIDLLVVSPAFARIPAPDRPWILGRANRRLLSPIQALWATPEQVASAGPCSFLREVVRTGVDIDVAA
jgi:predicted nucleotidyltransferase